MKLVENPGVVLTHSYAVWLALLNLVLFIGENMGLLEWLPFDQETKKIIAGILLALIPVVRILKQQSLDKDGPESQPKE